MQSDPNNDSTSEGDSANAFELVEKTSSKTAPKRRASRAGTRSVATLSDVQLARKRANDREAQRLIRQRTKDHIEQLETRIHELSGGKADHQELEKLRRRNSELEQELRLLKDNRASLSDGTTPTSEFAQELEKGKQGLLARPPSAPSSYHTSYNPGDDSTATSPMSSHEASWQSQNLSYGGLCYSGTMSGDSAERGSFGTRYDSYDDSNMMGMASTPMDPALIDSSDRSWVEASSPSRILNPMLKDFQNTNRVSLTQSFTQHSLGDQPPVPAWELPIRCSPPTGPIDTIFTGLVQGQRNKALNGASSSSITGPLQPDMKAIAYPEQDSTSHCISTVLSDLLKKTTLQRLPERAAALFTMYHLCRWQIYPSKATYNALLDWQIPRASQIVTAHPVWATYIAWPRLRDEVIGSQATYGNDDFQHTYISSLNLNWPWRDVDCFVFEKNGEVRVSEEFERHLSILANWSLDAPFSQRYPELEPLCRFTDTSGISKQYV